MLFSICNVPNVPLGPLNESEINPINPIWTLCPTPLSESEVKTKAKRMQGCMVVVGGFVFQHTFYIKLQCNIHVMYNSGPVHEGQGT